MNMNATGTVHDDVGLFSQDESDQLERARRTHCAVMTSSTLPESLYHALKAIHSSQPLLIATPKALPVHGRPARGKRASVAIILRIRPASSSPGPTTGHPAESSHSTGNSWHGQSQYPHRPQLSTSRATSTTSIHTEHGTALTPRLARLQDFFAQPWVQSGTPEILYIKRATRISDRWSAQVAFPGGRQEPDDENALFTAYRETWEEVGIDLAEKDFLEIGQLDDREITTSLGKRLLMVLSPFVFLHTSPDMPIPDIQASEVASAHWIPLTCLLAPHVRWGDVCIDITSRISPRSKVIRKILSLLTGNMHFKCILLPNEAAGTNDGVPDSQLDPTSLASERPPLSLWGLTLGMSLDLLSHMSLPQTTEAKKIKSADRPYGDAGQFYDFSMPPTPHALYPTLFTPSMTSIFPTFSYPDINCFIWIFGSRYRHLVKRWNDRISHNKKRSTPTTPLSELPPRLSNASSSMGRVNFSAMALNQFYAAVRKALIVAIIMRAVLAFGSISAAIWYLVKSIKARQRRLAQV